MEQVARGDRDLASIRHPVEREAVRIALRLHADRPGGPDAQARARMRGRVLGSLKPQPATISDRMALVFEALARPAPYLVRGIAAVALVLSLTAGVTVASADTLPDDPLYSVKVAAEQFRLALATTSEDRAQVELSIAEHRLAEAERLAGSGRVDDALVASGNYSEHVARAAAELAQLEVQSDGAPLVAQLDARFGEHRSQALSIAKKLRSDPATASAGEVFATVAAPSMAPGRTQSERIAETAASVAQGLAVVAEVRAHPSPGEGAAAHSDGAKPAASVATEVPEPARGAAPIAAIAHSPERAAQQARDAAPKSSRTSESVKKAAEEARKAANEARSPKQQENAGGKNEKSEKNKSGGDHKNDKGAPKR